MFRKIKELNSTLLYFDFHAPINIDIHIVHSCYTILYRARIVAVAASLLRGRGRVRIKSRDQRSRDLATLGPEVPLGHPIVRTSLVLP